MSFLNALLLQQSRQSDPIPTDPVPMPDPPPDQEPIKLSHRTARSARIRAI